MNVPLWPKLATLWQRAPKSSVAVLGTLCIVFAALLVLGLYRVQGNTDLASAPRFGVGAGSGSEYELDPNDPVARFPQTRVGHVLFAPRAGDHCQRVLFDNQTGVQYEAQSVDCSRPAAEVVPTTDRMGALRRTFQK
jgi:hypothetical protein